MLSGLPMKHLLPMWFIRSAGDTMVNKGNQLRTRRKTERLISGSCNLPLYRIEEELAGIGFFSSVQILSPWRWNTGATNSTSRSAWMKTTACTVTCSLPSKRRTKNSGNSAGKCSIFSQISSRYFFRSLRKSR